MIKKIALSAILASSLLIAAEPDIAQIKTDIAEKKTQIKSLEKQVKTLTAQLPIDESYITHVSLGYINTQGNTNTDTFSLDGYVKKQWGKHVGNFMFDGQYASDDSIETKNKYLTELTYNYEFTKRFAFNYLVGYKSDKFSGFAYQFYTGPGAQYKAIITSPHKLTFDGNILYAQDRYDAVYVDATGTVIAYPNPTTGAPQTPGYNDQYAAYRIKGVYVWQIMDTLKFDQELSFRGSFETSANYFGYSKSALTSKINSIFSAGISYKADYVNLPADGKEKTDTTVTLNLIMDY